jgi:hypothetical protein
MSTPFFASRTRLDDHDNYLRRAATAGSGRGKLGFGFHVISRNSPWTLLNGGKEDKLAGTHTRHPRLAHLDVSSSHLDLLRLSSHRPRQTSFVAFSFLSPSPVTLAAW